LAVVTGAVKGRQPKYLADSRTLPITQIQFGVHGFSRVREQLALIFSLLLNFSSGEEWFHLICVERKYNQLRVDWVIEPDGVAVSIHPSSSAIAVNKSKCSMCLFLLQLVRSHHARCAYTQWLYSSCRTASSGHDAATRFSLLERSLAPDISP
jgi:hypothetical protein